MDRESQLDELDRQLTEVLEALEEAEEGSVNGGAGDGPAGGAVMDAVEDFEWKCSCGQRGLDVEWTEKDTVYGHCPACKQTIFWNDPEVFSPYDVRKPFNFPDDPDVREKETVNGDFSRWYPKYRVRRFIVDPDAEVWRGAEVAVVDAGERVSRGEDLIGGGR